MSSLESDLLYLAIRLFLYYVCAHTIRICIQKVVKHSRWGRKFLERQQHDTEGVYVAADLNSNCSFTKNLHTIILFIKLLINH